jgi:nitroimidazol reductase NimA-like FMN-containing flavoprotein (pyridoxamine 5'-phosphate oxidase superfamily)
MAIEDLGEYGLVEMDESEIRNFLGSQNVGVLGLPADGPPVLRPLSYGYDEDTLYLFYVVGSGSRKADLSGPDTEAAFLVYSAETMFNWRSVLLTGPLRPVSDEERADIEESVSIGWRPALFEQASEELETALFRMPTDQQVGIKHTGLPPQFLAENEAVQ